MKSKTMNPATHCRAVQALLRRAWCEGLMARPPRLALLRLSDGRSGSRRAADASFATALRAAGLSLVSSLALGCGSGTVGPGLVADRGIAAE